MSTSKTRANGRQPARKPATTSKATNTRRRATARSTTPPEPEDDKSVEDVVSGAAAEPGAAFRVDPTDPASLNLDAFLESWNDEATEEPVVERINVTSKPQLARQAAILDEQIAGIKDAVATADAAAAEGAPAVKRRLAARPQHLEELAAAEAELERVKGELVGTWTEVEFQAPNYEDRAKLQRKVRDMDDNDTALEYFVALGAIRPPGYSTYFTIDRADWLKFIRNIGGAQFNLMDKTAGLVVWGIGVTPDFSRRLSQYRATPSS